MFKSSCHEKVRSIIDLNKSVHKIIKKKSLSFNSFLKVQKQVKTLSVVVFMTPLLCLHFEIQIGTKVFLSLKITSVSFSRKSKHMLPIMQHLFEELCKFTFWGRTDVHVVSSGQETKCFRRFLN